jgi:hypothetical protein
MHFTQVRVMNTSRWYTERSNSTKFLLLALLTCLANIQTVESKVHIISPDALKGTNIPYSLSTFGIIDYMATTVVKVFLWDDELACAPPSDGMLLIEYKKPKAFIVKKGMCSYEEKARNAHKAGARVVIVYYENDDQKINNNEDRAAVRPDLKVRDELPPVILVEKNTGELFMTNLAKGVDLQLEIDYSIGTFSTPVDVKFIYSPFDRNSLEIYQSLLKLNLPYVNKTKNHTSPLKPDLVKLQAHPKIGKSKEFEYGPNEIPRYCIPMSDHCVLKSPTERHPEYQEVFLGVALHCLHKGLTTTENNKVPNDGASTQKLITYLSLLVDMLERSELDSNISKKFLDIVSANEDPYSKKAISCIENGAPASLGMNESVQVEFMDRLVTSSGQTLPIVPAMYIEGRFVRGEIDRVRAIGAFCDVLKKSDIPSLCHTIKDEAAKTSSSILDYSPSVQRVSGGKAAAVFLLLAGIVVIIFYFTSKYVFKSGVQTDISKEIDDALTKYYNVQSNRNQIETLDQSTELTKPTA